MYTELAKEREAIEKKQSKLFNVLYTDDVDNKDFSDNHRDLLRLQSRAMEQYSMVLEMRMKDLDV